MCQSNLPIRLTIPTFWGTVFNLYFNQKVTQTEMIEFYRPATIAPFFSLLVKWPQNLSFLSWLHREGQMADAGQLCENMTKKGVSDRCSDYLSNPLHPGNLALLRGVSDPPEPSLEHSWMGFPYW